jgi:L-fuculose-phosphate aldolase
MDDSDIRVEISAARRILYREGCDSQTAGHVSVRAQDGDAFWVTPFQYFDETLPEHVVKASFDLELLEGSWRPSPAIAFHAAIYRARPDVNCVIHHHGFWTSVFATTGRIIGMYNIASSLFFEEQSVSTEDDENSAVDGDVLTTALGSGTVVLVKNHGAVVVGESLAITTIKALMVEKAAHYHIEAERIGGTELGEHETRRLKEAFHRYFLPEMWAAHMRRVRKSDPELFAEALTAG